MSLYNVRTDGFRVGKSTLRFIQMTPSSSEMEY